MSGRIKRQCNAPERDARGRFEPGSTGNPRGRPPARPAEPWSLERSIAEALDEEVEVTERGVQHRLQMRDLIVKTLIRSLPKAKPREVLNILERLACMGALSPIAADDEKDTLVFSGADLRLIEIAQKALKASVCPNCDS